MFKVLIPVDGSACSDRAVAQFIQHVPWFRETPEIHLLHVHAPIPIGRVQQHIGDETLAAYYREESEALLAGAEALLKDAGLVFLRHIHVGSAAELIVKLAREFNCDIVFMGTHGRGALPAVVLGSVANKVLHLADRPVMLVK
jgi:nucleotide-binding universal stress UspA family protein